MMPRFLIVFCCTLLMILGACNRQPASEIPVGLIAPLTGEVAATSGTPTLEGVELAIAEMNETGGLEFQGQKHPVRLVVEDDQDNPNTAVAAANKLINQEGVVALVGLPLSRIAIPVSQVAEKAAIPMVSSKSTNPKTTQEKRYIFRATFTDTFQGETLAKFAREELNADTAAVLYDIASNYNKFLAEVFKTAFQEADGEIVAFESYVTDQNEVTPQLLAIQKVQPDVLFLPNYPVEVTQQAQQSREIGLDATFLGGDAWTGFTEIETPELEGAYYTADWAVDVDNQQSAAFVAAYQEKYQEMPSSAAALGYDAVGLIFNAIATQQSATPEAIRDGLAKIQNYQGVTGTISFEENGDPVKSAVILRIENGKGVFDRIIEPN
ncbi:MAG: ABC transporter substrate-binding protein [Kamptonema sp. SIO4C4]|nr:ABC transporter substrate-binding protein [Kamptonema sp. SIO4C4]